MEGGGLILTNNNLKKMKKSEDTNKDLITPNKVVKFFKLKV